MTTKNNEVKTYDNKGSYTGTSKLTSLDPYSRPIKDFFAFGGSMLVNGETVRSHNVLAKTRHVICR